MADGLPAGLRDTGLALIGIYAVSAAVVGYAGRALGPLARAALAVAGLIALPFDAAASGWLQVHLAGAAAALALLALMLLMARDASGSARKPKTLQKG